MIKPESLWTLCKSCPDSKWVGDILRALGGQTVELDFGQAQMLSAIQNDSQWMDERIEKNRAKQRMRLSEYRERKKKTDKDNVATCSKSKPLQTDVAPCSSSSMLQTDVAYHPSYHPSIRECV